MSAATGGKRSLLRIVSDRSSDLEWSGSVENGGGAGTRGWHWVCRYFVTQCPYVDLCTYTRLTDLHLFCESVFQGNFLPGYVDRRSEPCDNGHDPCAPTFYG